MRGRSITNDSAVLSLFQSINNMHPQLLELLNQLDERRRAWGWGGCCPGRGRAAARAPTVSGVSAPVAQSRWRESSVGCRGRLTALSHVAEAVLSLPSVL